MPIITGEEDEGPGVLQEYTADSGDAFTASLAQARDDGLLNKGLMWNAMRTANGPMLPKDEVEQRAKAAGLDLTVPDEGMHEDALQLLEQKQYDARTRADTINSAPSGISRSVASGAGGLLGSLMDPVGFAASFIPFVGEARYAKYLGVAAEGLEGSALTTAVKTAEAAASFGTKALARAQVGAIEGAAGAALLEPVNAYLSTQEGDDYHATEGLLNIAFGGLMGGGLHVGIGAMGDAIRAGKSLLEAQPEGATAKKLAEMPHETRYEMAHTAIAQLGEDRTVDVDPIAKLNDYTNQVREPSFSIEGGRPVETPRPPTSGLEPDGAGPLATGPETLPAGANPEAAVQLDAEAPPSRPQMIDPDDLDRQIRDTANDKPNSRFVDPETEAQNQRIYESLPKAADIAEAESSMNQAMSDLKGDADRLGLNHEDLVSEGNAAIKLADEQGTALEAMALCRTRGGT